MNTSCVAIIHLLWGFFFLQTAEVFKAVLLRAIAATERLRRQMGQISVELINTWQPVADALGGKLGIAPAAVSLFSEEVCPITTR